MTRRLNNISFLDLKEGYEKPGVFFVNFIPEDFNFNNKLYKDILLLSPSVMSTTIGYINKHINRDSCLDCIVVDKFISLVNRKYGKDKPKIINSTKCISYISRFIQELEIDKLYVCIRGSELGQAQLSNLFDNVVKSTGRNVQIYTYVNY